MICCYNVTNYHTCENQIIFTLKQKFKQRKEIGTEYFEGDLKQIVACISEVC